VIRLIDCLFSVDLLAPAHHSLSNSSHGSPNYYLLIRKVSLLLYNINTVRRFSLVRTFASNVIVVLAGSHPPNGSHWTPHRSDVWDRKPSGFIPDDPINVGEEIHCVRVSPSGKFLAIVTNQYIQILAWNASGL